MENLYLEERDDTPKVSLDAQKNIIVIEGESYPENASSFYKPIVDWIQQYLDVICQSVEVNIKLLYFNTSTSKTIMVLFDMFEDAFKKGKKITVNWYFDEDDSISEELGEEFKEDVSFNFNIIEYNA